MFRNYCQIFFIVLFVAKMTVPVFAAAGPSSNYSNTYRYYLKKANQAVQQKDKNKARRYSQLASLYASSDQEKQEVQSIGFELAAQQPTQPSEPEPPAPEPVREPMPQPVRPAPPVAARSTFKNEPIGTVSLAEIISSTPGSRHTVQLEMGKTVIIEGRNLQRFLLIDPGTIEVQKINQDQMTIQALRRGSTFVHVWDESGRTTLFVEVVFPKAISEGLVAKPLPAVEHAPDFRVTYSNDWSAYYSGEDVPGITRQSLSFLQYLGLEGETPYGILDSSATFKGFDELDDVPTHTLGLSNIPMPGTTDLDVRGFDAVRHMTPLTMPGTQLRGIFADAAFLDDLVGVSFSHGRQRPSFGFLTLGSTRTIDAKVDAYRLILFPKDEGTQYSLNYAVGSGPDRPDFLRKKVYSAQAKQKIENFTLSGELAQNEGNRNATLSGIRWENYGLRTAVNFRNINREFTSIANAPSNQGEIGATWLSNVDYERINAQAVVDVYRNRLFFNPNNSGASNVDASGHIHAMLSPWLWNDGSVYYVNTPGELSPRRTFGIDDRMSRSFGNWTSRRGTVYTGGSYQKARYAMAQMSEYDRYTAIVGFQLPLTYGLTFSSSYEYSWLHEPFSGEDFNPNVYSGSLAYSRQFNDQWSGNFSIDYRDEEGVQGTNSFLAGEDSLAGAVSLTYAPKNDLSIFLDSRLRRVWGQVSTNPSYYDLDVHLGMRLAFGVPVRWDPAGTVSGYLFKDKNNEAEWYPGDEGLANVKVKVGNQVVTSDADGWYYADVRGKRVLVTPEGATVPPGFIYSTPASAQKQIYDGRYSIADFGLTSHSSVYGVVFVDKNNNRTPDGQDEYISKVKLVLDGKLTQKTDNQGAYYFREAGPGKHALKIDLNSIPIHMIPTIKLQQEVTVEEGQTVTFHIPLRVKEEQ